MQVEMRAFCSLDRPLDKCTLILYLCKNLRFDFLSALDVILQWKHKYMIYVLDPKLPNPDLTCKKSPECIFTPSNSDVDPHWFYADPDPQNLMNADPDPDPGQ